MGSVGGGVLPGGGADDLGTLKLAVADEGAEGHVYVLRQNVGIVVGTQLPQLQFVPDTQDQAGIAVGIIVGELHILPHPVEELGGRDAGVQQEGIGQRGAVGLLQKLRILGGGRVQSSFPLLGGLQQLRVLADIGGQQLPCGLQIPEVGEKAAFLRVGKGIYGEMGRAVQREGEVILPSDPLIPAESDQTEDGVILVFTGLQKRGVKGQAVSGLVGHKGPAGAVSDDAPGGLHIFHAGDGLNGFGQIFLVVNNLGIEKDHQINGQHCQRHGGHDAESGELGGALVHDYLRGKSLIVNMNAEIDPAEQPGHRQAPQQGGAQLPQGHGHGRTPCGMALSPKDDAVEDACQQIGGQSRGGRAEIPGWDQTLGQQSGGEAHKGEDQSIKAGNGGGEQQVAENATGKGVDRAGGGALKDGGEGGNQGIEKGNDAPDGHTLEKGGLNNGPDQPGQSVQSPFKNRGAAGQQGESLPSVMVNER